MERALERSPDECASVEWQTAVRTDVRNGDDFVLQAQNEDRLARDSHLEAPISFELRRVAYVDVDRCGLVIAR